ncbi:MAG TPA: SCO family protein [Acidimicrobiales bacterium]|nr:SCO family protein [Acidimicrobiales bacterium]
MTESDEARRVLTEPSGTPDRGRRPSPANGGWLKRNSWWIAMGTVAAIVAVFLGLFAARWHGSGTDVGSIRPSGIPSNVPTRVADLMELSPTGAQSKAAPDFTLTDQDGRRLSLSAFRGHPVVLTFLDPRCVTMCPIMAQEFVDAERHLRHADPNVVFLAVNVNRHALSVATVETFTKEHQLDTVRTWHFLTGTLTTLKRVWSHYGIQVSTQIVHGQWTVVHTDIDYFISPSGQDRFLASPGADYRNTATHKPYLPGTTYAAWGRGIALVASDVKG